MGSIRIILLSSFISQVSCSSFISKPSQFPSDGRCIASANLVPKTCKAVLGVGYSEQFSTQEEAILWISKTFPESRLYPSEAKALSEYGARATAINSVLRLRGGFKNDVLGKNRESLPNEWFQIADEYCPKLDSALSHTATPNDVILYRRMPDSLEVLSWETPIGSTFVDPAYVSTSLSSQYFNGERQFGGLTIRIFVPKGSKISPVFSRIRQPGVLKIEMEVLIPRNSKFKVLDKQIDDNGIRQIYLELIL